ncbi:serine hydrolase [Candidatus Saccharibacteria bacterium]|nr:serine hydrolase [Candidatus Saccharibacteria bacterium]
MVPEPPKRISPIIPKQPNLLIIIIVGVVAATLTFMILFYFSKENYTPDDSAEPTVVETEKDLSDAPEAEKSPPSLINFQETLDSWAASLPKSVNYGVLVYDLDNEKTVGELNADQIFNLASLYKLFVVYEGYRRVDSNEWDGSGKIAGNYTISECLDLSIRESNSTCAESLLARIGESSLEAILNNNYNLKNASVENLTSSPRDFAKFLKLVYTHESLSDATFAKLLDSMLNQPATKSDLCDGSCDWRMGLPSGFSASAKVYNKVGWSYDPEEKIWKIYNDAALVSFPDKNRNYAVVVLTENLPASSASVTTLTSLASALETLISEN